MENIGMWVCCYKSLEIQKSHDKKMGQTLRGLKNVVY